MNEKKLKNANTNFLIHAQQQLDYANQNFHGFFGEVEKQYQNELVSFEFYKETEASCRAKIEKNNELIDLIDQELFERLKNFFGASVSTVEIMPRLVEKQKQELERVKKKKEKEKSGKTLELKKRRK